MFSHNVVIKCSDISKEHNASIYRVTESAPMTRYSDRMAENMAVMWEFGNHGCRGDGGSTCTCSVRTFIA